MQANDDAPADTLATAAVFYKSELERNSASRSTAPGPLRTEQLFADAELLVARDERLDGYAVV